MKLAYAYFEKYFYIRYMPINANASRFRYGSSFYRLPVSQSDHVRSYHAQKQKWPVKYPRFLMLYQN